MAKNTFNPIRNILETMDLQPNPDMRKIDLSLGDPTSFKRLRPHQEMVDALLRTVSAGKSNGYGPSVGQLDARKVGRPNVNGTNVLTW